MTDTIRQAVQGLRDHFARQPEDALGDDKRALAVVEEGLRCRATGPYGWTVTSDMPAGIGGGNAGPSPGWLLRAALANCDATVIAMRAAELGVRLTKLEVEVGSRSDARGLVGGGDDAVAPGPLETTVRVRLAAQDATEAQLRDIVAWAERHSPVNDALRRAVPVSMEVVVEPAPPL